MTSFAGPVLVAVLVLVVTACTSFDPYAAPASTSSTVVPESSTVGGTATSTLGAGGTSGGGGSGSGISTGGTTGVAGSSASSTDYCTACQLTDSYVVAEGAIDEASGIAASRLHEGVYYINNDSGDVPRFFAVDAKGGKKGTFFMPVTHVDYEDIDVGPCPGGTCVFVADIGDNDEERSSLAIHRVREPAELGGGDVAAETFPFVYADGPHNAETLLVHPVTGEIAVVTKNKSGPSPVFHAPADWSPGHTATFTKIATIEPPSGDLRFTGGSVHPDGRGVLLRTYTHLYYYAASAPDAPLGETLSREPCALPVADEQQGEAVAWTVAGDGYVTISEGDSPSLHHASCHAE